MQKLAILFLLLCSCLVNAAPGAPEYRVEFKYDGGIEWLRILRYENNLVGFCHHLGQCDFAGAKNACELIGAELPAHQDFIELFEQFNNSSNRRPRDLSAIFGAGIGFYWTSTPVDSNQKLMSVFYKITGLDDDSISYNFRPSEGKNINLSVCIRRTQNN